MKASQHTINLVPSNMPRITPMDLPPLSVVVESGSAPLQTPCAVEFYLVNTRPWDKASDQHRKAVTLTQGYFGKRMWVNLDGTIHEKAPFFSLNRWFPKKKAVALCIDFQYRETEISAACLPDSEDAVVEISMGLEHGHWMLVLGHIEKPGWQDCIMFDDDGFYLLSVRMEFNSRHQ